MINRHSGNGDGVGFDFGEEIRLGPSSRHGTFTTALVGPAIWKAI
jgi:hypothetical protein